jgi:hypothetical protein
VGRRGGAPPPGPPPTPQRELAYTSFWLCHFR